MKWKALRQFVKEAWDKKKIKKEKDGDYCIYLTVKNVFDKYPNELSEYEREIDLYISKETYQGETEYYIGDTLEYVDNQRWIEPNPKKNKDFINGIVSFIVDEYIKKDFEYDIESLLVSRYLPQECKDKLKKNKRKLWKEKSSK